MLMAVGGMTVAGRQAEAAVWGCELEGRPMLLLLALRGVFLLAGLWFNFESVAIWECPQGFRIETSLAAPSRKGGFCLRR